MMPMTPERHAHALNPQAVRPLPFRRRGADRDRVSSITSSMLRGDRLDAPLIEPQPIEQRGRSGAAARAAAMSCCVGGEDARRTARAPPPPPPRARRSSALLGASASTAAAASGRLAEPLHQLAERSAFMAWRSRAALPAPQRRSPGLLAHQHQVVAVNHLVAAAKAEELSISADLRPMMRAASASE